MITPNTWATRRHLPHLQKSGRAYFVTAVTFGREVLPPSARTIILDVVVREDELSCLLHCAVVMPDHAHLILTPDDAWTLPRIMQRVKGTSSHFVNEALARRGRLCRMNHLTASCGETMTSKRSSNTCARIRSGKGWSACPRTILGCGRVRGDALRMDGGRREQAGAPTTGEGACPTVELWKTSRT